MESLWCWSWTASAGTRCTWGVGGFHQHGQESFQSLNKKWDSAFVSRRHSGQRIIKMAAEWSVRRNPIKGNCPESQSWGSSNQEESETLSQKESVRTIYLVYPVSKKTAKNRSTFSARIPIKAALKQKTIKSVKPAANWLHGKCLISNIKRLKYSSDSFFLILKLILFWINYKLSSNIFNCKF